MAECSDMVVTASDAEITEQLSTGLEPVEAFVKGMTGQVNAKDVTNMVALQQHMLSRFEKSNEMLLNFNHVSENRFVTTQLEFKKHINLMVHTKKELDNVFRRIRILKEKLRLRYPDAFAVCAQVHHVPDDESQDEEELASQCLQPLDEEPPAQALNEEDSCQSEKDATHHAAQPQAPSIVVDAEDSNNSSIQ